MRIVMITDDVQIDRRILHEADSLIAVGHEIILVALHEEGLPKHEWIGRIKVERFTSSDPPPQNFPEPADLKAILWIINTRSMGWLKALILTFWISFGLARTWLRRILLAVWRKLLLAIWDRLRWLANDIRSRIARHPRSMSSRFYRVLLRAAAYVLKQLPISRAIDPDTFIGEPRSLTPNDGVSLPPLTSRELLLLARIRRFNPDVIHAHDLPQLGIAIYLKRLLNVPVVYDAHELYPEIDGLTPEAKMQLARKEQTFIREADCVITVNPLIANEMANRYGICQPLVVLNATKLPAGFDPTVRYQLLRNQFAIGDNDTILLYQGWMSRNRGLQALCGAMAMVPKSIHLVFMGYGDAQEELQNIARTRGLESQVHFKGAVPQSELLFWTASADAGIIPYQGIDLNYYYCSPNKLFEFILAGLPIIANDLPFLRSVVAGQGFGIVQALDDEQAYAEAIKAMFDLTVGGPARFRQAILDQQNQYSWEHEEQKIIAAYRNLSNVDHFVLKMKEAT